MFRRISIKNKLLLISLILCLVPITALYFVNQQQIREGEVQSLMNSNTQMKNGIEAELAKMRQTVLLLASNPAWERYYTEPERKEYWKQEQVNAFKYVRKYIPDTDEACFLDDTNHGAEVNRVYLDNVARPEELSLSEQDQPFYEPAIGKLEGEVYQTANPYVSADSRRWVIANLTPIVVHQPGPYQGKKVGLVHYEVNLASLSKSLQQNIAQNTQSFLLDAQGELVAHSDEQQAQSIIQSGAAPANGSEEAVEDFQKKAKLPTLQAGGSSAWWNTIQKVKKGSMEITLDSKKYFAVYQPLEIGDQGQWTLVTLKPASLMGAETKGTSYLFYLTVLLVFLLLMGSGYLIKRWIVTPIDHLVFGSTQIANGNLNHSMVAHSQDEVGRLIHTFDQMRVYLLALVGEMNHLSTELTISSEGLSVAARKAEETSNQIFSASNEIASGVSKQADQSGVILKKMEDTLEQVKQGNQGVHNTLAHATASTDLARRGEQVINEAISHLDLITNTVSFATESIQKLGKRSEEIGGIITSIQEIANQTNLLALNAAIEAARAGEQGRGFAIVAEEVRKLAEQSSESAKQITSLIMDIQEETVQTVQTMESNLKAVENQVNVIDQGGKLLVDVVRKVEETEQDTQDLQGNLANLSQNANDALTAIQEISAITQQSAAGAQEVAASIEGQFESIKEVANGASQLSEISLRLRAEIQRFKV
ncbi:MAG TPA: methyl-accepting chemotaxis protein [Bacillota bacterium]|nr:methyl-accepting chemotaxis protein [Bacillota bacterium]